MNCPNHRVSINIIIHNKMADRFQCDFEFWYKDGKTMGRMVAMCSPIRLTMYSLFQ